MLAAFARGAAGALGDDLIALYVFGSLLMGDFDPASSDVDFLAVTAGPLGAVQVAALAALHRELARTSEWGGRLEGEYAPRDGPRPWGIAGTVAMVSPEGFRPAATSDSSADNMLAVLQHGRALHGPPAAALLPPVDAATLAAGLRAYLAELLARPFASAAPGDAARWSLNIARCLYGLQTGRLSTKPQAARWLAEQAPNTAPLLAAALALRAGQTGEVAPLRDGSAALRAAAAALGAAPPSPGASPPPMPESR